MSGIEAGADRQVSAFDPPLLTKKEVEGVAVSTERLDCSEEALDLKKAVWARFIAVVGRNCPLGHAPVRRPVPLHDLCPKAPAEHHDSNCLLRDVRLCQLWVCGSPKSAIVALGVEASLGEGLLWSSSISHSDRLQSFDRSANPMADPEQSFAVSQCPPGNHSVEYYSHHNCRSRHIPDYIHVHKFYMALR